MNADVPPPEFSLQAAHSAEGDDALHLVWERQDAPLLRYEVSRGSRRPAVVRVHVGASGRIVRVEAAGPAGRPRVLATLDTETGEFHDQGDFISAPADGWAIVRARDGVLREERLPYVRDGGGNEELHLLGEGLVWQRSGGSWRLVAGVLPVLPFPCPREPYAMRPPALS